MPLCPPPTRWACSSHCHGNKEQQLPGNQSFPAQQPPSPGLCLYLHGVIGSSDQGPGEAVSSPCPRSEDKSLDPSGPQGPPLCLTRFLRPKGNAGGGTVVSSEELGSWYPRVWGSGMQGPRVSLQGGWPVGFPLLLEHRQHSLNLLSRLKHGCRWSEGSWGAKMGGCLVQFHPSCCIQTRL